MVSNVLTPTEKQLAIEKAARESNPMEKLGDSMVFKENGLDLKMYCKKYENMSPKALKWAWKLAERNVSQHYKDCSLGWQPKIKQADMNKKWARYLVATEGEGNNCYLNHVSVKGWFLFSRRCACGLLHVPVRFGLRKSGSLLVKIK